MPYGGVFVAQQASALKRPYRSSTSSQWRWSDECSEADMISQVFAVADARTTLFQSWATVFESFGFFISVMIRSPAGRSLLVD